jgi:hypothetical protein
MARMLSMQAPVHVCMALIVIAPCFQLRAGGCWCLLQHPEACCSCQQCDGVADGPVLSMANVAPLFLGLCCAVKQPTATTDWERAECAGGCSERAHACNANACRGSQCRAGSACRVPQMWCNTHGSLRAAADAW